MMVLPCEVSEKCVLVMHEGVLLFCCKKKSFVVMEFWSFYHQQPVGAKNRMVEIHLEIPCLLIVI